MIITVSNWANSQLQLIIKAESVKSLNSLNEDHLILIRNYVYLERMVIIFSSMPVPELATYTFVQKNLGWSLLDW